MIMFICCYTNQFIKNALFWKYILYKNGLHLLKNIAITNKCKYLT